MRLRLEGRSAVVKNRLQSYVGVVFRSSCKGFWETNKRSGCYDDLLPMARKFAVLSRPDSQASSGQKDSNNKTVPRRAATVHATERDKWVLSLLQLGPLDCQQLFRASQWRPNPFRSPHKVARRMRKLNAAGLVNTHEWLITLTGTKVYYSTTYMGRDLVLRQKKAKRSLFEPISLGEQEHKHKIGDITAATVAAADRLGFSIEEHTGDRQFKATIPGDSDVKPNEPDRRCILIAPDKTIELWDEIDLHTESISGEISDSLEKKILFHTRRREAMPEEDYLVRVFFRHQGSRMRKFLALAAKHATGNQFIFLATSYDAYCLSESPLTSMIFYDHANRLRRCYKPYRPARHQKPAQQPIEKMLAEPALV